jgi:hypothetical protein
MTYAVCKPVACRLTDLDSGTVSYETDGEDWVGWVSIDHAAHDEIARALVDAGFVDAGFDLEINISGLDIYVYRAADGYPLVFLNGNV